MLYSKLHSYSMDSYMSAGLQVNGELADLDCSWMGSSSGPHWVIGGVPAPVNLFSSWGLWAVLVYSSHEDG